MNEPPEPARDTVLILSAGAFYLALGAAGLGLMWLQEIPVGPTIFGHTAEQRTHDCLLGVTSGLVIVVITALFWNHPRLRVLNQTMRELLGRPSTPTIAWLALTSAVGEELFFRGGLQPLIGLWPTAILFGLLHGGFEPKLRLWAVFATIAGVLLGYLSFWTGNLQAAILCHLTVNFLNLQQLARRA